MADIRIEIDMSEWFGRLDSMLGPTVAQTAALDAAMVSAFETSQSLVHVITGSLRGSGKVDTRVEDEEWSGEITYGGSSPGYPNDPVEYTHHEYGRGGEHAAFFDVGVVIALHDLERALTAGME